MSGTRIAIDPGVGGGIVVEEPGGSVHSHRMPDTPAELSQLIRHYRDVSIWNDHEVRVVMERLPSFHRQGNSASASCKLALTYGWLEGIIATLGIPCVQYPAKEWQRTYAPLPKNYDARKREVKRLMQARHPGAPVTLATADAFAILGHDDLASLENRKGQRQ